MEEVLSSKHYAINKITIFQKENKRQLRLRNGLMTQHAYSVTGLARVRGPLGDTPLVRLRNPWGEGEWTGPWSERSWEWDGLSHRDKELLSVRVRNDGEFWWVFLRTSDGQWCGKLNWIGSKYSMNQSTPPSRRTHIFVFQGVLHLNFESLVFLPKSLYLNIPMIFMVIITQCDYVLSVIFWGALNMLKWVASFI